jgi:hypothetical protein
MAKELPDTSTETKNTGPDTSTENENSERILAQKL